MTEKVELKWWQKAVFYQVYPRSFADGNGDGIGDLAGMISRLDYLKDLGVDAIWLSPHYPSPYVDCGYDISDYCDVAPEYGTLGQFKEFLDGLHERGMRLVLDLVLNHTSDQHTWFQESRSSLDNPKRDWYVWKRGKEGNPPTNWFSAFGGSAWQLDLLTGEYYYHYFFKEQPDLNWKNPQVQEAMFNAARFWLDMGVDGFRLDAIGTIFEDESYPPMTLDFGQERLFKYLREAKTPQDQQMVMKYWTEMFKHQVDQPAVHQVTRKLRQVVDEYHDRVLIGETDDVSFYGNNDELHLNFNFPLMRTEALTARHVKENQRERLSAIPKGAWPCNTLGNHDSSRVISQFCKGEHALKRARLYLMMLLSLQGTPFLYNGEEIGMTDYLVTDKAKFRDPLCFLYYDLEKRVMGSSEDVALIVGANQGRDKNRTPLQWDDSANGGFCPSESEPWLPVNPDYQYGVNVASQEKESDSLLNFYKRLLWLRKENPALIEGDYEELVLANENVIGFTRVSEHQKIAVILNLGDGMENVHLPDLCHLSHICSNDDGIPARQNSTLVLGKYQGLIFSFE